MVLLAESSTISVPMVDLAKLQLQLLNDQQPPATPPRIIVPQAANGGECANQSHTVHHDASPHSRANLGAEIAESTNAHCTSDSLLTKTYAPQLSNSKSASEAEMEAMLRVAPVQETARPRSFHGFPGGDTQPMESQVYRDYSESMAKPSGTTFKKTAVEVQTSPDRRLNTYDTTATDETPRTCQHGDTGFIDLARVWEPVSPAARSDADFEDLLASPETQLRLPTQSARLFMPETPAVAGHKRDHGGEIINSDATTAKKTPAFTQLFGGVTKGQTMTATQLFDQTQAPSSPTAMQIRSDPVFDRPSPNLENRADTSPFAPVSSSPVLMMHSRPTTAAGEPRDTYMSMRESQARRVKILPPHHTAPATHADDDEDDEDDDIQLRRQAQQRAQRALSDQARSSLENLRAPSRPGSRPGSSRKQPTTIDLVTPATVRRGEMRDVDISDDEDGADDNVVLDGDDRVMHDEDDLPHGDDDPHDDAQAEENDIYDELGQTVLRSQSNLVEEDDVRVASGRSVQEDEGAAEVDDLPEDVEMNGHGREVELQDGTHNERGIDQEISATQRSRIADSQIEGARAVEGRIQADAAQQVSLLSSFVSGSQHVGTTSQDRLRTALRARTPTSAPAVSDSEQLRLPSSPPLLTTSLPTASSTIPDNSAEASVMRREVLQQFQRPSKPAEVSPEEDIEIPDSDVLHEEATRPASAPRSAQAPFKNAYSNSVPFYSTAQTHQSGSGPSPLKHKSASQSQLTRTRSQLSNSSSQSPRKAAGIQRFAEISFDSAPSSLHGKIDEDIDDVMSHIVTAEDNQLNDLTSSPKNQRPIKRRKLTRQSKGRLPIKTPAVGAIIQDAKLDLEPQDDVEDALAPVEQADAETESHGASIILRSSPSKANELIISTPEDVAPSKSTQESAKKRETAGAEAVAKLLAARPTASKTAKISGTRRRPTTTFAKDKSKQAGSKRVKVGLKSIDTTIRSDAEPDTNEQEGLGPVSVGHDVSADQKPEELQVRAPCRIFALFKGSFNNYYPATWVASSADGMSFRVEFDDTSVTSIDVHHVRALDLRVGDLVKVDSAGMRVATWTVEAFGRIAETTQDQVNSVDIYGRSIVKVRAKSSRSSGLHSKLAGQSGDDAVEVHISNVYINPTMWPRFADRHFDPPEAATRISSQPVTPSAGMRTPDAETSGSRSRRAAHARIESFERRPSHLRNDCTDSILNPSAFNGMAFAISYGANNHEKAEVTNLIALNGGVILESGFDELFDLPSFFDDCAGDSPNERSPSPLTGVDPALTLKPKYEHLGFVALIADNHSRRVKYLQALALGLPTLSGRWIIDSFKRSDKSTSSPVLLPWSKYLLAAGNSGLLGGATRSRTLAVYDVADARLANTLAKREVLIHGDNVLIVSPDTVKSVWERRQAYAFLALGLGAGAVKRVLDLEEARELLDRNQGNWRWLCVYGSIAQAREVLVDVGKGKKRKRSPGAVEKDSRTMIGSVADGKVNVVSDEFVVQSVILGTLPE